MAKVIIFGIKDLAELAHFYLENDSEHEVVAFSVNEQFLPATCLLHDLPIIPFENIEKNYPVEGYKFFAPLTHKNMNRDRENIYKMIKFKGYEMISYVSSRATLFNNLIIGDNCFVLEDNTIQPFVEIGNNVVLWSGNHIGHHSTIKDHVFITSHVVISGNCIIGSNCFIGVNAALKENTNLGKQLLLQWVQQLQRTQNHSVFIMVFRPKKWTYQVKKYVFRMKWNKKGLIYCNDANYYWNKSHAQVPVADIINDNSIRIYYSSRDKQNRSNISFIEVDSNNPQIIKYKHDAPILPLGRLGCFDDSGIMPSSIITKDNRKYLYYTGWNVGHSVGYRLSIGLAISDDNMAFKKISDGPILDRSIFDPCLCSSASVFLESNCWHMWYISGTKWEIINLKPEPFYHIKYAHSKDGINWIREGKICVDYDSFSDAISGPSIIKDKGTYFLYYSYRNNLNYRVDKKTSYRIGYSASSDGTNWDRKDKGMDLIMSDTGWDSEMMAYPNVIRFKNKLFMFYNGNGFGKTGFGYAILEE